MSQTLSRAPLSSLLVILPLLAALGSEGCVPPRVERPSIRVINVAFASADVQNITFRVDMAIFNPNTFELPVRDLSADLSLEGRRVGNVTIPTRHVLPPRRELAVSSQVVMPWGGAADALAAAVFNPQLHYRLQGEVTAQVSGWEVRAPYEYQGIVPRQTLLQSAAGVVNGIIPGLSITVH